MKPLDIATFILEKEAQNQQHRVFSLFYFELSNKRGNFAHYFYLLTH